MKNTNFPLGLIKLFILILLGFSILTVNEVQAQRKSKSYLKRKNRKIGKYKGGSIHFDKNKRYLSGGISVDAVNYFGDLTPKSSITSTDISFTRSAFSIYGTYRIKPNLSLRGSLSWARLKGDDFKSADPYEEDSKFRYVRNISFRNDIKELAFVGIWDIFGNHGTFLNRVSFTPYVYGGIAVFHHNPKAKAPELDKFGQPLAEAGEWVALRELGTEGQLSQHYNVEQYSLIQPSIPFGLGLRARLNKRWDFEFEVGYRYLFTDYIDDVSGLYVDLGALDSELAKSMSDRSREPTGVNSGTPRDFEAIESITRLITYTSEYDNMDYTVYSGYGHDHTKNDRGLEGNDMYIVTSLKISYILSGSFKRAKFR